MQGRGPDQVTWQSGEYTIVSASRRLLRGGQPVDLEAKVFDLILLLVENRDRAVSKQEVVSALWGNRPITDAALSQLLYKARRALDDDGERQTAIRTVYGRGLQWVAPIKAGDEEEPAEPAGGAASRTNRRHKAVRTLWLGTATLVLAALSVLLLVPRQATPAASPQQRLAVLPIENSTGDATLDWTRHGLPGLIGSLLGDAGDMDVIDPLQVARVWGFTPPQGRNQTEHVRLVTGADITVGGRLRKLTDKVYELTLQVDAGSNGDTEVTLAGSDPSKLGVEAVARIRRALKLEPPTKVPLTEKPRDAYLAETFARGMDAATHGHWQDAKLYFALVAKGDPNFLQARFALARAQESTDEPREAEAGYTALLAEARRLGQRKMVAKVLKDQLDPALNRHQDARALRLATQAVSAAEEASDPEILAGALMGASRIHARARQMDKAMQLYEQARALIEKTPIPRLGPSLHDTMLFIAGAKGDRPAAIAAARAELEDEETIGDERSAAIASYNLGTALVENHQQMEALPLFARTWSWANRNSDASLQIVAGGMLAGALCDMDLCKEVQPIVDLATRLAGEQGNKFAQAQILNLRTTAQYFSGDKAAALATSKKATALTNPVQDPSSTLSQLEIEASIAVSADPASLPDIAGRTDAAISRMKDASEGLFVQRLVHALKAATIGDRKGVQTELEAAAKDPRAQTDLLHQTALRIALVEHDDAIAEKQLHDFDLAGTSVSADTLHLYAEWCNHRGDTAAAQRASARLATLRRNALDVLAEGGFDPLRATVQAQAPPRQ